MRTEVECCSACNCKQKYQLKMEQNIDLRVANPHHFYADPDPAFTSMLIRIQPLMRIRILIKVVVFCDHWSIDPSRAPFWASRPPLWALQIKAICVTITLQLQVTDRVALPKGRQFEFPNCLTESMLNQTLHWQIERWTYFLAFFKTFLLIWLFRYTKNLPPPASTAKEQFRLIW